MDPRAADRPDAAYLSGWRFSRLWVGIGKSFAATIHLYERRLRVGRTEHGACAPLLPGVP